MSNEFVYDVHSDCSNVSFYYPDIDIDVSVDDESSREVYVFKKEEEMMGFSNSNGFNILFEEIALSRWSFEVFLILI